MTFSCRRRAAQWQIWPKRGWPPWEELTGSLRTGQPGFDLVYRAKLFEYLAANPPDGAIFKIAP